MKKALIIGVLLSHSPLLIARNAVNISTFDILFPIISILLLIPCVLGGIAALIVKENKLKVFKTWFIVFMGIYAVGILAFIIMRIVL